MRTMRWVLMLFAFASSAAWAEKWVKCADEEGVCTFDGTRRVGFGVGSKWSYRTYENSTQCNVAAFGDPAPGKRKRCRYLVAPAPIAYRPAAPQWVTCAQEGQTCGLSGKARVAFGTGSNWVAETFVHGIECSTAVFGDPAPGKRKECRYLAAASGETSTRPRATTSAAPPPKWVNCAVEGGTCRFDGRRRVSFGIGSTWITKVYENGVQCTRERFGDPAIGKVKECRYDAGSTVAR